MSFYESKKYGVENLLFTFYKNQRWMYITWESRGIKNSQTQSYIPNTKDSWMFCRLNVISMEFFPLVTLVSLSRTEWFHSYFRAAQVCVCFLMCDTSNLHVLSTREFFVIVCH